MESTTELQVIVDGPGAMSPIAQLADNPEEEIWLAKQKSRSTRRVYKLDVQHFMPTLHIKTYEELRQVDHRAVIAWERMMRENDGAEPSTIRRELAALSSLFKHLKRHHHVEDNPVADVERPAINRRKASTLAFSKVRTANCSILRQRTRLRPARSRDSFDRSAGGLPPRGNRGSLRKTARHSSECRAARGRARRAWHQAV
jgi:hypothetical protein